MMKQVKINPRSKIILSRRRVRIEHLCVNENKKFLFDEIYEILYNVFLAW